MARDARLSRRAPPARPRCVLMVAYDRANTVDVVGPLEVFAAASQLSVAAGGPALYENVLVSVANSTLRTSSGVRIVADHHYRDFKERVDTLLVAGGDPTEVIGDAAFLRWVASRPQRVRRLGSVCSGAFILAAAGLLDGRRATTHWSAAELLAELHPRVQVDPDAIYVEDDGIYTSAGVTAGMDLALALVEADHGRELALSVARQLVLFLKRPGGQRQFSTVLAAQSAPEGALAGLPEWLLEHLGEDLRVERLAHRAAMSPRNFARTFVRELGTTPAKFVERARVERARLTLERGDVPLETIAWECGFGSPERMRRTFHRHLGVAPQDYRRVFVDGRRAAS